jgi:hypothetical protein
MSRRFYQVWFWNRDGEYGSILWLVLPFSTNSLMMEAVTGASKTPFR